MSTPNDNRAGFGVEAKAGSLNQPVKGKIGQPRPAAQPSPSAVEQALAEEQANNEKIGATVQAAKASATQPELPQGENSYDPVLYQELLDAEHSRDKLESRLEIVETAHEQLRAVLEATEQQRDALQAQRDELQRLLACKDQTATIFMNQVKDLQECNAILLGACKVSFDILRREGPRGFDTAAERLTAAIARATEGGTGQ